ncbi:MAG: site-specific DNA-methyltransferase [Chloroflexi bacterium]|nr:site-specific DNA-methyltransferase [Chloroflexota bacterium]
MQRMEFNDTNANGNYATHAYFRYFGKLPPAVIRFIIRKGTEYPGPGDIVDIMCGCGTSLVESMLLGHHSIGIDINPVATLVSKVKTTLIDEKALRDVLNLISEDGLPLSCNNLASMIPKFRNVDYWFLPEVQLELAKLKYVIQRVEDSQLRDFFMVAFLSILRRSSNSSPTPGRLFHIKHDRVPDVKRMFVERANMMIMKMRELRWLARCTDVQVLCQDARQTSLAENCAGLVIFHPPYFALYRYSSDVLRFELEWYGANRESIAAHEIEDGFKTTNISLYGRYIEDVVTVLAEASRILKPGHKVCLVVNNSTFRDERLPVMNDICSLAARRIPDLTVCESIERGVRFQQASYHRSAREDKVTSQDYLVFFRKQP